MERIKVQSHVVEQTVALFKDARRDLALLIELVPDHQFWKVRRRLTISCHVTY